MKKRILALLCALGLVLACPACAAQEPEHALSTTEISPGSEETTPFTDVSPQDWFADAAAGMARRGIMSGVEAGLFAPYREVTRATIVIVLWRMEGEPQADMDAPFPDIEDWYAAAANWARSMGIATGYTGVDEGYAAGAFGGRDPLTREQLAVFLYRYAQYKGEPIAEGMLGLFSDAFAISDWAEDAMRHAVGLGIIQGGGDNTLNPKGVVSRAELAVMLHRMLTPAAG